MFDSVMGVLSTGLPDSASVPTTDLVSAAAELHRLEAAVSARKHAFAAALLDRFDDGSYLGTLDAARAADPWDLAEAELAAALTVTSAGASALIWLGHTLSTRLPNVWDAFARGDLDSYRVKAIAQATTNVDPDLIKEVEARILAVVLGAAPVTGRRLRTVIDRIIVEVDADGVRERRKQAEKERHVWIGKGVDGMAELSGSLPAPDAVLLTGRLGEMAKRVCREDPRSFDARRADALIALARGETTLACRCERADCPYRGGAVTTPRKALVHVIATRDTLAGYGDVPGWLDGYGIVDADQVRDIAADAVVRDLDPDTTSGADGVFAGGTATGCDLSPDATALRYRPREGLRDLVRALAGSCQFPTCDVPAWECDVDHREAFDHEDPECGGSTVSWNLGPFCRKHHNGKTHGGWVLTRHADGSLTLTSPLGFVYPLPDTGPVTLLGGDALPRPDSPADPKPKRRNRSRQHEDRIRRERAGDHGENDQPPPF